MIGFSSGLPLFVLFQLIPAWLRKEGISLTEIGLFMLVGLPYNLEIPLVTADGPVESAPGPQKGLDATDATGLPGQHLLDWTVLTGHRTSVNHDTCRYRGNLQCQPGYRH